MKIPLGIAAILAAIPVALYFSGAWKPNQPSRIDYPIRGIDISHYQGEIQWNKVAASGIRFAYIKATEGTDYDDPDFKKNWDAAGATRFARGAYHFFTIGAPGKLQAEHFLSRVLPYDPALPTAIDIELTDGRQIESVAQFQHELSEFITIVEARLGEPPLIYSSRGFRERYLQGFAVESWWINDVIFTPKQNSGERWNFWQYSWRGRIPGIAGFVDLDVFSGSEKDFQNFPVPHK